MNLDFHNLKYRQIVVVGLIRDTKVIQSSSLLFIHLSFLLSSFAFLELEIVSS